eukprot:m.22537 g.22537  ORF g.22537 m.22537 type:complete len:452 (+) comp3766_c0_seq1:150-1505(+)
MAEYEDAFAAERHNLGSINREETARLLEDDTVNLLASDDQEYVVKNATKHQHGLFLTIVNLANDDITVGVVATCPLYFIQGGLWVTLGALIAYLCLNAYTLQIVHRLVARYHYESFPEMCRGALGRPGFYAACAATFFLNWGSQLIQLLILGNTAPDLLADISDTKYFTRSYVLVGFVLAASPICFFKSVGRLAIPSLLNQIFVMTALSIVLYKTIEAATQNPLNKDVMEKTSFLGVLSAVGGLSYFYVCQDMAVQVMHALKRSTGRRWAIVSWTVPGLLMVMVVLLGLIGSLYLPDSSDLLSAIGSGIPAKIARGCIVGAIFCAVPYNTYMPRVAILGVLKDFIPTWTVKDKRDPGHNRFKRNVVHVTITVSLIGSALLLAEFVDDLGLVLEFVGAVSGVGIGLILPPLCYIAQSPYHWSHPENHLVLAVLIIGVASMGGCVASLLISNT